MSKEIKNDETVLYFKDTRLAAFTIVWKILLSKNIKVVIETHIPFPQSFFIEHYAYSRADHIITITKSMREILEKEYNVLNEKISILPDGIDLEKFDLKISRKEARRITRLPLEKKIVLYCGSVGYYNWKGEDVFIESAQFFGSDYLFVMVGGDFKDAKKSVNEGKIPDNVLCIGRQSHSLVPYYLKAADVLILPNKKGNLISEKLTSPLKLFEYMASSVPIISSDLPSTREILNENNALLIEPNNSKILAASIKAIITNERKAKQLASQSRIDVENYEWQRRARKILNKLDIEIIKRDL
jgi:glycosyltransferase involved in cell wall biosynthesis